MMFLSFQNNYFEKSLFRFLKFIFNAQLKEVFFTESGEEEFHFISLQKLLNNGNEILILNPGLDIAEKINCKNLAGFYIFQEKEIHQKRIIPLTDVTQLKRNTEGALKSGETADWDAVRKSIATFKFTRHGPIP